MSDAKPEEFVVTADDVRADAEAIAVEMTRLMARHPGLFETAVEFLRFTADGFDEVDRKKGRRNA